MNDYILREASKRGIAHERCGRENEDRSLVIQKDDCIWLGVFDGVSEGGGGAVAATVACKIMEIVLGETTQKNIEQVGLSIMKRAQEEILTYSAVHPESGKMRSTATIACIDKRQHTLTWFSIGDGAGFICNKKGKLQKLTIEDTDIGELVAEGKISRKTALQATVGHELNRWLGMDVKADMFENYIRSGCIGLNKYDSVLLCTDGLHSKLPDKIIARSVQNKDDIETLIIKARKAGSQDDITLILASPAVIKNTIQLPIKLAIACMVLSFAFGILLGAGLQLCMKEHVEHSRHIIQEKDCVVSQTDSLININSN